MRFVCWVAWLLRYLISSNAAETPVKYQNYMWCQGMDKWIPSKCGLQLLVHTQIQTMERYRKMKVVMMPTLLLLVATEVVIMTTSGATTSNQQLALWQFVVFSGGSLMVSCSQPIDTFTLSLHNPDWEHMPAVRAVQGDCQWPMRNHRKVHQSHEPVIHCNLSRIQWS